MTSKHTPGPYSVNGSHIYAPDGAIIAVVHNAGSKEGDYPLIANRNLFASAPALLEALTEFVEEYVALVISGDAGFWDPEKEPKVIKARAAIAASGV